jgi:peptidase M23-like protein
MTRWVAVLAAAALIQAPAAAGWSCPVDGPVLRPFVFGDDPYAGGQHRGIDIGAPPETPVRAASAGTVSFAGTVPSGGRTVTVQTEGGLSVTYLELGALRVARGAEVVEGDPIGTVGPVAHVHLGVRVTADPHGYRDPLLFLPARVEAPPQADPAEAAPPAAAQPDPVVEPSVAQAVTPELDGSAPAATEDAMAPSAAEAALAPSAATEPAAAPSAATEPAAAPPRAEPAAAGPDAVATESAADVLAEPSGEALPEGAGETPAPEAEPVATRKAPASADATEPAAPPGPRVARAGARPAPDRARAAAKGSAERPSTRVGASPVPVRSKAVVEPVAPVSVRPRAAATVPLRQARLSQPPALHGARGPAEREREESGSAGVELALGLLPVAVLTAAAAAAAVRRQRSSGLPEGASPHAAARVQSERCRGRLRAPHVIHACARAREPGWFLPGSPPRRPVPLQRLRPVPRPRRRVLAGARS